MSDHDLMIDELLCRGAMAREGLYTYGWRLYRDGGNLPRNADAYMLAGFRDAQHRVELLRDRIDWSAERAGDDWEIDEPVSFRRSETDRDMPPARV